MRETPTDFNAAPDRPARYPADNLAGFRWHTGASLRPLAPDESCPVLFRDVGPAALALFLRGLLPRLAGPLSPIVYMRTADYVEPYTDNERTGRLVFLRPLALQPWHSGVAHVYVAKARPGVDSKVVGFVPGDIPLAEAAIRARGVRSARDWRGAMGGRVHDESVSESLSTLDRLARELARTEEAAAPLRRALQSADRRQRERALAEMDRAGLTEVDLCAAWHHLPRERRAFVADGLCRIVLNEGGDQ